MYSISPDDSGTDDHVAGRAVSIPEQYRGTAADQHDMLVLGKRPVLRRNFKFVTMLGFASTVMISWEWVPIISIYALQDGGLPIVFWGLLAGCISMAMVYASLAEMASM